MTMRLAILLLLLWDTADAFAPIPRVHKRPQLSLGLALSTPSQSASTTSSRCMRLWSSADSDDSPVTPDAEGADLMAEFYKLAKERNIELEDDDLDDWDDEEDEKEDSSDEETVTKEVTATGDTVESKASGTDEKATGSEPVQEDEKPKEYKLPTKIPDPNLTAGEVVKLVLDALAHNDVPTKNKGIEILFAYSSEHSQVKQMEDLTPEEYADYLREGDLKLVFENQGVRVEKGEYSPDGSKAYYTARIQTGPQEFTPVNFILSTGGERDDDVWMVDSMLIRPAGMRRNRRR